MPSDDATDAITDTLKTIYGNGYLAGAHTASLQSGVDLPADLAAAMADIDWDSFDPLDLAAASYVRGSGLQKLLDDAQVVIRGFTATQLARIGDKLATGLERGLTDDQIADSIRDLVVSDAQAKAIATTETARAQSAAAIDIYRAMGIEEFDWVTDTNPCPVCIALEASSPHPLDSERPPAHPHCACHTQAVLVRVGARRAT